MKQPSIREARLWVWKRLLRRAGQASVKYLRSAWSHDAKLLDVALIGLRDDSVIAFTKGVCYLRDPAAHEP